MDVGSDPCRWDREAELASSLQAIARAVHTPATEAASGELRIRVSGTVESRGNKPLPYFFSWPVSG